MLNKPVHCSHCDGILDEVALATNICSACGAVLGMMGAGMNTVEHVPQTPIQTAELPVRGDAQTNDNWLDTLWNESSNLFNSETNCDTIGTLSQNAAHVDKSHFKQTLHKREVCHDLLPPESPPDYQILRRLGEGGMGIVYRAEQVSLKRSIALKMIKPGKAAVLSEQEKFSSEAIVTSNLDHPNIVPIYDLAEDDEGNLFYTMRQVSGTPWSQAFDAKSLQQNIEILLDVANAIAYAHDRGIIHRDIKPENVMLGEYGEVILMDWGLAAAVDENAQEPHLTHQGAVAGTPAYMAPEMALGLPDRIGKHSDIYLLGGILFEIITGQQPHTGESVRQCLRNVMNNVIEAPWIKSQLVETALKAMATEPEDRFATVKDFQKAIREHADSVVRSTRARKSLINAQKSQRYEDYARALFGFQEAIESWAENTEAITGESEARTAYAAFAIENGDHALARSLLQEGNPDHASLLDTLKRS